ncbi:hypothetical protein H4F35_06725 [Pectobacterium versatile]|uniref:hypothetical protein n=1 Tax=Pectobacterium versatile TaxID=2488639 RepID=UPI000C7F7214|nr:hypothetical protein [Pectobacterium versatile]MBN3059434.1 hypothetical protein [Pectobacterium versatile]PLY36331.1 hypothetical protein F164LOC_15980 [Pectobacterium carotovorum]
MTLLLSEVTYHGVGQGLFISGEITSNERSFKWVYDCGSSSKSGKLLLEREIKNLFKQRNEPIVIDMLVISHFDRDHINGCESLLKTFKINKVILPYIPLWKRILLALEQKVGITGKYIDFYINPTQYINEISENKEIQIEYIDSQLIDFNGENISPTNESQYIPPHENESYLFNSSNVKLRKNGGILIEKDIIRWEFVFYNDEAMKGHLDKITIEEIKKLCIEINKDKKTIKKIKEKYEEKYTNKEERNTISLFMYSGPTDIKSSLEEIYTHSCSSTCVKNHDMVYQYSSNPKSGFLFTGDGYLNTQHRFEVLKNSITEKRMNNILSFQIMHHGSKNNWFHGIANEICPIFSVFSSNPERSKKDRYGKSKSWNHPDPEVVMDFYRYNPIQVDLKNSFYVHAYYFI